VVVGSRVAIELLVQSGVCGGCLVCHVDGSRML
jgi:hypothetical protein